MYVKLHVCMYVCVPVHVIMYTHVCHVCMYIHTTYISHTLSTMYVCSTHTYIHGKMLYFYHVPKKMKLSRKK